MTEELLQDEVSLKGLPGPAADLDVRRREEWVAVCRTSSQLLVCSVASQFAVSPEIQFPLVRWFGENIVVVDTRTRKDRDNGFIFSPSGELKASFRAGDGIADVVAVGDSLVVTYFDEGVFSGVPPSKEGLCVFSSEGHLEFGYGSGIRDPVDIVDCYCACAAGRHEVCFLSYTGFPLVRLNLSKKTQQIYETPHALAGAHGISTDGVDFLFHGPYMAKQSLLRWRPGTDPVEIGSHSARLRGLERGAFLSTGTSGYTIVTVPA